jgi:hypothetical protein
MWMKILRPTGNITSSAEIRVSYLYDRSGPGNWTPVASLSSILSKAAAGQSSSPPFPNPGSGRTQAVKAGPLRAMKAKGLFVFDEGMGLSTP